MVLEVLLQRRVDASSCSKVCSTILHNTPQNCTSVALQNIVGFLLLLLTGFTSLFTCSTIIIIIIRKIVRKIKEYKKKQMELHSQIAEFENEIIIVVDEKDLELEKVIGQGYLLIYLFYSSI